ncbi:MAG: insulinase family protein [Alphaproteobacteria bacterium]|nr:insulinase family protein [Alphaproteobacteria bacterium]
MTLPLIRRFGAATLLAALLIIGPSPPCEAAVFDPETFTLDNGMQVVVITNRRASVVTHHVWYRIGSSDSPPGKSGLPHFHEHLMFKATTNMESGAFSKEVARNGGNENAFTGPDYTGYFQTIAKDRLELVMKMEADRMTNLVLAEDEVLRERDVVLEERSMRVDNNPSARFAEQMNAAQFLHHPYRMPVIGWRHEIEAYSREDSLDFYRTWYAPNNAVLLVAGDIDAEELRPLAEKYYGVIPAREIPERVRVKEPPQAAARSLTLRDARVRQPSWLRSYLAPSFASGETEHAYPLTVLAEILGGTSTSRLYRSLVIDQKIATSAGAYYRGSALDLATFRIYASPKPGVDMDQLEAAVDAELERLRDEPITADEVARATKRLVAEAVYARDSMSGAVRSFGIALTTGRSVDDVEAWPERIAAVSADDIAAAALAVLAPERSVTGQLLPEVGSEADRAAVSQ